MCPLQCYMQCYNTATADFLAVEPQLLLFMHSVELRGRIDTRNIKYFVGSTEKYFFLNIFFGPFSTLESSSGSIQKINELR